MKAAVQAAAIKWVLKARRPSELQHVARSLLLNRGPGHCHSLGCNTVNQSYEEEIERRAKKKQPQQQKKQNDLVVRCQVAQQLQAGSQLIWAQLDGSKTVKTGGGDKEQSGRRRTASDCNRFGIWTETRTRSREMRALKKQQKKNLRPNFLICGDSRVVDKWNCKCTRPQTDVVCVRCSLRSKATEKKHAVTQHWHTARK